MDLSNNSLQNILELLKSLSGDSVWHKDSEKRYQLCLSDPQQFNSLFRTLRDFSFSQRYSEDNCVVVLNAAL